MAKNSSKQSAGNKRPALTYTGPDYLRKIRLPASTLEVDPRSFDAGQLAAFLETYPDFSHWWTAPEAEVPDTEQ